MERRSPTDRGVHVGPETADQVAPDRVLASVIVPTWQRRASVARLLEALTRQTLEPGAFEVIVVVDGSTDGTVELLAAGWRPLQLLVHRQDNSGRAAACNAGLALARAPIVALLDDDMEPDDVWLAEHLAAHGEARDVAVMGAVPTAEPAASAAGRYIQRRFDRHLARLARPGTEIGFRDVFTGNLSIDRNAILAVGGYDATFTAYGNEDGELAIRLMDAGTRFAYRPSASARQHQDKDLAGAFQDARAKGATAVALARLHPTAVGALRLARPGSGRRRWARRVGLRLADRWPISVTIGIRALAVLGRVVPRRWEHVLDPSHDLLLDVGYWLGVRDALSAGDHELRQAIKDAWR
jgi:GT2 family glycosyltransferase